MRRNPIQWRSVRKGAQIFFLLCWLTLWVSTAGRSWNVHLVRLQSEIDPLLALAQAVASRALTAGMLLSLIAIGLTLLFGRAWCGWICPVGTVLDFFPFRSIRKNKPVVSNNWRRGKYSVLLAIFTAALLGTLSLLLLDPITLWLRTMTGGVGPALNTAFTAVENALGNIPWMSAPLTWIDGALRPAVFPLETVGIRFVWLPVLLFGILILLNLLAERFWCRYLCPLGALTGFISRIALVKRQVSPDCKTCGQCTSVCPMGTIDPDRGYASDPAECTLCMDCLDSCPVKAVRFQPGITLAEKVPYDPGRRQVLVTGAVTLLGLSVIGTKAPGENASNFLIRPPGALDADLLQKCLRCGLCLRACPTGALQPSLTESGWTGLFTPVVVPRLGYCLYSCSQCGTVCPVEAIPPLPLPEKQKWVMGHAFIDQNRCIPWADGVNCIICEEMCPLPEKAILLEE
ncbi:MAG: 4Fe-4S binding protein, partial [Anaerolineaceae bacterium]